ncbi:MAG TPA: hypothetical protein VN704_05575 [Verrucomicrobiae bacterium]|nr:hypothetical protein [Verrucomicrobiae bacterium]
MSIDPEEFKTTLNKVIISKRIVTGDDTDDIVEEDISLLKTPEENIAFIMLCSNTGNVTVKLKDKTKWKINSKIIENNLNSENECDTKDDKDDKDDKEDNKNSKKKIEFKDSKLDLSEYNIDVAAKFLVALYCQISPFPEENTTLDSLLSSDVIPLYKLLKRYNVTEVLNKISKQIIQLEKGVDPIETLEKYKPFKEFFPESVVACICFMIHILKNKELCYDDIPVGKYDKKIDHTQPKCCHSIDPQLINRYNPKCEKEYCCLHRFEVNYDGPQMKVSELHNCHLVWKNITNTCKNYPFSKREKIIFMDLYTLNIEERFIKYRVFSLFNKTNIKTKILELYDNYNSYRQMKISKIAEVVDSIRNCCSKKFIPMI